MSILSVLQQAATKIGMEVPTAVMASTAREHVELKDVANEVATRIAKAHDWRKLALIATYTGDGTTEDFNLPTDYDRMPKDARVWSSSITSTLRPMPDLDTWLGLDVQNTEIIFGAWIIYGGQIHIKQALASAATAKHWYQSNLIVDPVAGVDTTAFALDTDTFRLDERLLRLGIIWEWKAQKGRPYAEDMSTFEEAKEKLIAADKGAHKLVSGRRRFPYDADYPFPYVVTP